MGEVAGMLVLTASYSAGPICDLCGRPWTMEVEKEKPHKAGVLTAKEFIDRFEPGQYEQSMDELRALGKLTNDAEKKNHA